MPDGNSSGICAYTYGLCDGNTYAASDVLADVVSNSLQTTVASDGIVTVQMAFTKPTLASTGDCNCSTQYPEEDDVNPTGYNGFKRNDTTVLYSQTTQC
jgi:hypothetical protein